jgi:hypothetical protein
LSQKVEGELLDIMATGYKTRFPIQTTEQEIFNEVRAVYNSSPKWANVSSDCAWSHLRRMFMFFEAMYREHKYLEFKDAWRRVRMEQRLKTAATPEPAPTNKAGGVRTIDFAVGLLSRDIGRSSHLKDSVFNLLLRAAATSEGEQVYTTLEKIRRDLIARSEMGIKKYGVALGPFNGRDSKMDAYQELLDAYLYYCNAMYEEQNPQLATPG